LSETNPAAGDRFKFTAREYDESTALYYYRARYYDAAIGRFLSEDPIGFAAGDPNLYRYVLNRPTRFIDVAGMDECDGLSPWEARQLERIHRRNKVLGAAFAPMDKVVGLMVDTAEQVVLGEYSDKVTGPGIAIETGLAAIGADAPMDVRDLYHHVTNWEWSWRHVGETALYGISLLPIVGMAKILKHADKVDEVAGPAPATIEELLVMMNKREGVTAEYATGELEAYLKAIGARGSHMLDEAGHSHILLRKDVATRRTAFHEWLHRRLQRINRGPTPGEDQTIEDFLERHKRFLRLEEQ
ncbi:MAG TPA: hypothetical protein EYP56_19100, partial [Planctomycetaceae bacterium]|nr:hypothetical protein [Planctomycetaceae bacterium]